MTITNMIFPSFLNSCCSFSNINFIIYIIYNLIYICHINSPSYIAQGLVKIASPRKGSLPDAAGIAGIEPANAGVMVPDNRFALLFDNLSYLDESDKSRALPLGYIPLIITYIQLCRT